MRALTVGILVGLFPTLVTCQDRAGVGAAVATITPADIQRRINVLADDSMKGRSTTRPEIEKAASYIAGEFRRVGLNPGGDQGTFLGRYAIEQVRIDTGASRITVADGTVWRFGQDVVLPPGVELIDREVTAAALVLSGVPDTAALRRIEPRGAIVIFALSTTSVTAAREMNAVLAALRAAGPAAVLLPAAVPDSLWRAMTGRQPRVLTRKSWDSTGAPILLVRDQAVAPVLARHGVDLAAVRTADYPLRAVTLPLRLSLTLRASVVSRVAAPNVAGILEGSDPALKNEYVVFSAHMDHLGVRRPDASGDSIYNGADDDASGTAAVLELAEAFARLDRRPRRSLIFLTVSGEEMGLFGSEYFAARPPVPVGQMVADLNIDMVGRNWKDTIVAIGREHSDLGATLARVGAAHPELRMAVIDDPWPSENFYSRSDHYNFARRGVPILFFFSGTHPDYHRPSDHADKIDAEKEARIVRLIFYLGLEIANAAARPKWNPESYRQIVEGAAR